MQSGLIVTKDIRNNLNEKLVHMYEDEQSYRRLSVDGILFELLIERDLDKRLIYAQMPHETISEVSVRGKNPSSNDLVGKVEVKHAQDELFKVYLELLFTFGGFSLFLYLVFWLLTSCCIQKWFDDYLIQNVLEQQAPKSPNENLAESTKTTRNV